MTDEELREYLEAKNKFRLIKSKSGHIVFKKILSERQNFVLQDKVILYPTVKKSRNPQSKYT